MKMLTRLLKKNKSEQNLASAASAIIDLENKLVDKEAEADDLREALEQLYKDAVLGEKDSKKIGKIKADLEELQSDIEGIKSVIESANTEAVDLAQKEIEESLATKTKLQEQLKLEIAEENNKMLATLRNLLISIYRLHGARSAISKTPSFRINISTDSMQDEDITVANKELAEAFDKTTDGPAFIAEQIKKIEEQTGKTDPKKEVEKALQDARTALAQKKCEKAA